jgi:pyruvate dehydrogenase E1 component alpha subunit
MPNKATTNKEELMGYFKNMVVMRRTELEADRLYKAKLIRGFCHLYDGQESIAEGMEAGLNRGDAIITAYRDHCQALARGDTPYRVIAEMAQKRTGSSGGKGGSMHIADLSKGMLGANGIVGGGLPLVCGAALTYKTKKSNNVSVGFFGDGASNQGSISESMNMASVLNLPAIFVCEDNGFAESTSSSYAVGGNLVERAKGFGLDSYKVDGTNFFEVYNTFKEIIDNVRSGKGPAFLHVVTNRVYGLFEGDAQTYKTKEENENIRNNKDPIKIFKKKVIESGLLDIQQLDEIQNEMQSKVKKSILDSKSADFPTEKDLLTDVYVKY